jgi:hypothetical protein
LSSSLALFLIEEVETWNCVSYQRKEGIWGNLRRGRGSSQTLKKKYELSVYLFVPVPTPACSLRVLAAESKILRAQWLLLVTRIAPVLVGTRDPSISWHATCTVLNLNSLSKSFAIVKSQITGKSASTLGSLCKHFSKNLHQGEHSTKYIFNGIEIYSVQRGGINVD